MKARFILYAFLLIPSSVFANPDLDFTVEDSKRYLLEGHGGNGVFEAKPSSECIGLNGKAHWCATVTRPTEVKATVAMIGDSKMTYIFPGFVRNAPLANLVLIARPSCPPLFDVQYTTSHDRQNMDNCEELSKVAADTIAKDPKVTHVFMTFALRDYMELGKIMTARSMPSSKQPFQLALDGFIQKIAASGKKIIFFIDTPTLTASEECFPKTQMAEKNHVPGCVIPKSTYLKSVRPIVDMIHNIEKTLPANTLFVYDIADEICLTRECSVKKDDHYLYETTDHLTDYSNDMISKKVARDFHWDKK